MNYHDNYMKRPYLFNFMAIASDENISVKASVSQSESAHRKAYENEVGITTPIQSIGLISSEQYRVKIVGMNMQDEEIFKREYESDSFGNFDLRLPWTIGDQKIAKIQVYENSQKPGLELLLGSFIPLEIKLPKKIIISDFDKTLCDTKFSTAREMMRSLRSPLSHFPTIDESVNIFKSHVQMGFQPFVLSASPHFYEKAIRDWLYQNQIFESYVFLKDYRNIFSLTEGILTPKDLKKQGFYKLSQLVNILNMTGIPEELVLLGDGFESDTFIYLTLASVLIGHTDPWNIWNQIKKESPFSLTTKQNFQFLSKFYALGEKSRQSQCKKLKIHIRCNDKIIERVKKMRTNFKFIEEQRHLVEYYTA